MDDAAIIELFFARDERAILETRIKYGGYCRAVAYNLLASADDSEECVSDAMHAAWESIPPERPQSLRCYLGRITRNLAVSRWRSEHAKKRSLPVGALICELEECIPSADPTDAFDDSLELAACLNEWLASLSGDERALFILRFWHGYGINELSERAGAPPDRVSRTLFRLKKSLKSHLTAKGVKL